MSLHFRRMARGCLRVLLVTTLSCVSAGGLTGQELTSQDGPSPETRKAGVVATSQHFTFYSDFWMCLHDRLYGRSVELNQTLEGEGEEKDQDEEATDPESSSGWDRALAFYREHIASFHHRSETAIEIRAALILQPTEKPPQILKDVFEYLTLAAPDYRKSEWIEHDRRNRAWIEIVHPLVEEHEASVVEQLAELYQHPWPDETIPVDVAPWAGTYGANTIAGPNHIMISSLQPGNANLAGFEMTFHEASHLLTGWRYGKVFDAVYGAIGSRMLPRRDLWHTLLFYTTGKVVQELLADEGYGDYEPYLYKQGLFDRAWPMYRVPIETHWQPYIDGDVDLATASRALAKDIPRVQEDD